jgi:hypothetical protein
MPETTVLRSSASPKNVSPHMAGGRNHTQLSASKPIVQVTMANGGPIPPDQKDRNVMLSRPTVQPRRAISQPVSQQAIQRVAAAPAVAEIEPQNADAKPMVEIEMDNGRPVPRSVGVGTAPVKPMIQIRMDNGKPVVSTGKQTPNNVKILTRPAGGVGGMGRTNVARGMGRQVRRVPQQPTYVSPLSSQQLLLARHAIALFTETELDDNTQQLANDTLIAIDAALTEQTAVEAQQIAPPVVVSNGRPPAGVTAPRRFANRNPAAQRVVKAPIHVKMTDTGPQPQTTLLPPNPPAEATAVVESEVVEVVSSQDVGELSDVIDVSPDGQSPE